jgi:hypothetical protein
VVYICEDTTSKSDYENGLEETIYKRADTCSLLNINVNAKFILMDKPWT